MIIDRHEYVFHWSTPLFLVVRHCAAMGAEYSSGSPRAPLNICPDWMPPAPYILHHNTAGPLD